MINKKAILLSLIASLAAINIQAGCGKARACRIIAAKNCGKRVCPRNLFARTCGKACVSRKPMDNKHAPARSCAGGMCSRR